MSLIQHCKAFLRRQGRLYEPVRAWRARRKELEYSRLRDHYLQTGEKVFSPPGHRERAAALWRQQRPAAPRPKKSLAEVNIFVVDKPNIVGFWFLAEFARAARVTFYNITRHQLSYAQGNREDPDWVQSFGEEDRFTSLPSLPDHNAWRAKFQENLLQAVVRAHRARPLDLVFAYGSQREFAPETLQAIRALGVPVALLWLDDRHAYAGTPGAAVPNGQKPLIGSCDVHLTNSLECVRWYMSEGAPALYFPPAVDPEVFRPGDAPKDLLVSFVGGAYGMRGNFIRKLRAAGIPVTCFGHGWEHGPVRDNAEIYARSLINLGFAGVAFSDRIFCVKGRDPEVPAAGSLYITTYNPELAWLFQIGKEIHCYHNEIDCVELMRYYLERPEEAEAVGRAGRERCLREHTWTHRLTSLLHWMGILDQEV